MKILLTNDDGIQSPQLLELARWAKKLGDVTVVAPKCEHSGKSQGIELHTPFEVRRLELEPGIPGYSVDSTPADCIRYAAFNLDEKFDLVISGVNRGYNIGTDIMYSGTVGAVFESVSLGMRAVAVSTCPEFCVEVVRHLDPVLDFMREHRLMDLNEAYNINIPPDSRGIRVTRQGGHFYSDDFLPAGGDLVKAHGKCVYVDRQDDTLDTDAVMHGFTSVMPLTINRCNMDVYRQIENLEG